MYSLSGAEGWSRLWGGLERILHNLELRTPRAECDVGPKQGLGVRGFHLMKTGSAWKNAKAGFD